MSKGSVHPDLLLGSWVRYRSLSECDSFPNGAHLELYVSEALPGLPRAIIWPVISDHIRTPGSWLCPFCRRVRQENLVNCNVQLKQKDPTSFNGPAFRSSPNHREPWPFLLLICSDACCYQAMWEWFGLTPASPYARETFVPYTLLRLYMVDEPSAEASIPDQSGM